MSKKKTKWVDWFFGFSLFLWLVVVPALTVLRLHQDMKRLNDYEDALLRIVANERALNNKLNTLHEQMGGQIDCTYQVVPQVQEN